MRNLTLSHRYIHSSNICHLQQQLDCIVRSDTFGHCQSFRDLGEDFTPCSACRSSSRDYVQFYDFYQDTYQILPPPLSQFGTCSLSSPEIDIKYVSLLVQVLECSHI